MKDATNTAKNDLVLLEKLDLDQHQVAVLTFNRPEARNPMDGATLKLLHGHLAELTASGTTSAIILTGAGVAFSAGGDLKHYRELYRNRREFERFVNLFGTVCDLLESSRALTVSMINGTCLAGGLEIALACDLITMSSDATIGDGHLRFGQLPGAGGSQRLVKALGAQRAKHWLLTAHLFSADQAVEAGLVFEAIPHEKLLQRTLEVVASTIGHSPLARLRMKELVQMASEYGLREGLRREIDLVVEYACGSHDALEGLDAFADGRAPRYIGK